MDLTIHISVLAVGVVLCSAPSPTPHLATNMVSTPYPIGYTPYPCAPPYPGPSRYPIGYTPSPGATPYLGPTPYPIGYTPWPRATPYPGPSKYPIGYTQYPGAKPYLGPTPYPIGYMPWPGATPYPGPSMYPIGYTPSPGATPYLGPTPYPIGYTPSPGATPYRGPGPILYVTTQCPLLNPTATPEQFCIYGNTPYRQGEIWSTGSTRRCVCNDAASHSYYCFDMKCEDRLTNCGYYSNACSEKGPLVTWLKMYCPRYCNLCRLLPNPILTTTTTTAEPNGCRYKNHASKYVKGDKWVDGCDLNCECVDDVNGVYRCHQRCRQFSDLPKQCHLVYDVRDPCCKTPVCDNTLLG